MKKTIIISGVNLSEGGPLTIISSILKYLNDSDYSKDYDVYALVHSKSLFKNLNYIKLIEFPKIKSSWIKRLKFEYKDCLQISKELNCYLWISMHDITPNVVSDRKVVYCHNASPFYKPKLKLFFVSPTRFLYAKLYKYLYAINIKKNNFVVVQQKWIKDEFIKLFRLKKENIVVSLPLEEKRKITEIQQKSNIDIEEGVFNFFYPAFPRDFKNFELICEAIKILNTKKIEKKYQAILTLDGKENTYSKNLLKKYGHIPNIKFIGLQPKDKIESYYKKVDGLIFPSKLETWGLPISEFKQYNKPIIVANLPYAYETVGDYEKVKYVNINDSEELAQSMEKLIKNELKFNNKGAIEYENPICRSWEELIKIFIEE